VLCRANTHISIVIITTTIIITHSRVVKLHYESQEKGRQLRLRPRQQQAQTPLNLKPLILHLISHAAISGFLSRAIIYALPVPILILVDPTVTPACFLVITAAFYVVSYRAGKHALPTHSTYLPAASLQHCKTVHTTFNLSSNCFCRRAPVAHHRPQALTHNLSLYTLFAFVL
jgi:hypothetical protein